jgi:ATP-dependent Clp protease protease subunit
MTDEPREPTEAEIAAKVARDNAEAAKLTAEARKAEADAAIREMERAKAERQRAEELAANKYHCVYRFTTAVDPKSVQACMEQLDIWTRLDPPCEITIIFTSPGGDVVPGLALWDYLQGLRRQGHVLRTHTEGMAASMAGILLQAGSVRSMGSEAWLLIHEVQAGMMGSWGELEDRMGWLERVQDRILDIFAARATISKATIKRRWKRQDWWIDSAEALKLGFVDEVT